MKNRSHPLTGTRVVMVGAGNIGSHLVDLLARLPLGGLTVIDRDRYTVANRAAQNIQRSDVGRAKAVVAARRAVRIAGPRLKVRSISADLASVPWGVYHAADVVIGCLDSHRARIDLQTICWRLGRPLIDCGVNPDGLLARATVFRPGPSAGCYMCTIKDWSAVEAVHACAGFKVEPRPTGAPAFLGASAAALALGQLLRLRESTVPAGEEIVITHEHGRGRASRWTRNPQCRFDHRVLDVRLLRLRSEDASFNYLFRRARRAVGNPKSVAVPDAMFATRLVCSRCSATRNGLLRLHRRLPLRSCLKCRQPMVAHGFSMRATVGTDELHDQLLSAVGLVAGDVVSVSGPWRTVHFLIAREIT